MKRLIFKHLGLLGIVAGSVLLATPALAYTDTTPGSGGSTTVSSTAPGSSFTFKATFAGLAPGTVITFSGNSSVAGCTVTFSQTTATLDANSSATVTATPSAGCAGTNVAVVATGPNGQTVSATVAVAGGFPNTSTAPVQFGWIVMAAGALAVLLGIFGISRRRETSPAAA